MDRAWAGIRYRAKSSRDTSEGWVAVDLLRGTEDQATRVARVIHWDAQGQFALEMFVAELPLVIVEELIAEAKATIRVS